MIRLPKEKEHLEEIKSAEELPELLRKEFDKDAQKTFIEEYNKAIKEYKNKMHATIVAFSNMKKKHGVK